MCVGLSCRWVGGGRAKRTDPGNPAGRPSHRELKRLTQGNSRRGTFGPAISDDKHDPVKKLSREQQNVYRIIPDREVGGKFPKSRYLYG